MSNNQTSTNTVASTTTASLPPPPFQSPISNAQGVMNQVWLMWFQQLYLRVGGSSNANPNVLTAQLQSIYAKDNSVSTGVIFYGAAGSDSSGTFAPNGVSTIIDSFTAQNTSGSAETLSVWVVPYGQLPVASNLQINALSIAAGATVSIPGLASQTLGTLAFIVVQASVNSAILCTMNGRQIS